MKRLLIVATLMAVLGVVLATTGASAQQERDEVMVVIPMKYMSAATAASIFGGAVIAPSPFFGQSAFGNRGAVGRNYGGYDAGYQSGPSIGGGLGQFGYGRANTYRR
ncbi:MAG: hypothetical protein ACOX9R_19815 [Armatimonadota bacterium]